MWKGGCAFNCTGVIEMKLLVERIDNLLWAVGELGLSVGEIVDRLVDVSEDQVVGALSAMDKEGLIKVME